MLVIFAKLWLGQLRKCYASVSEQIVVLRLFQKFYQRGYKIVCFPKVSVTLIYSVDIPQMLCLQRFSPLVLGMLQVINYE